MNQKHNNLIVEYYQDHALYRVTKIRNKNVLELDEIFDDPNLAKKFFDSLVSNIEYNDGFTATVSSSKKNRVQGYRAIYLATFGNLGIEVGLSVRPIVKQFKNLRELADWESSDNELILEEEKPKGFMDKLKSLIK